MILVKKKKIGKFMLFIFYVKIRSKMMLGDIRNTKVFPGYIIDRSAEFSVNNCLSSIGRRRRRRRRRRRIY